MKALDEKGEERRREAVERACKHRVLKKSGTWKRQRRPGAGRPRKFKGATKEGSA